MNSQNILKFWGSKFDLKLDTSEFHDYEVGKTEVDYNTEVLDLTTPIVYSSLKINTTGLMGTSCSRDRITITEYDNRINDPTYPYSAYTWTLSYSGFTNRLGNSDTILHNDVYEFVDVSGFTHYFTTLSYNSPLNNPFSLNVTGLTTGSPISCVGKLQDEDYCCSIDSPSNAKPWAYQTDHGVLVGNDCNPFIKRRTEKGWTLDFVFNREELPWSVGKVFYYLGTRGDSSISDYADNNLSFSFTDDRRIQWRAVHYSGACSDDGVYGQSYYIASGQTPQLCIDGTSEDFEITITFDRYRHLTDCNIENDGGWNDLIPEHIVNEYVPNTGVTAVTSTQIATHNTVELLNKKWADERNRRLGVLKIYLNGRPVYKIKDWEEIIPSTRGVQPFIQSWGAGTQYSGGIHNMGISCFNFKRIQYYEEPLDFVHVRHHYLVDVKPYYNIIECVADCPDEVIGLGYVEPIVITLGGVISSGSIVCRYDITIDRVITEDVTLTTTNTLKLNDESILEIPISITIYAGDLIGQYIQTLPENFGDLNKTFFEYTQLIIDTISTEQFNDNVLFSLIFSEITPTSTPTLTPTPTPTLTYYYYYLRDCNQTHNKIGRSLTSGLGGITYSVGNGVCYEIVGIDPGPTFDYDLDTLTTVSDCTDVVCLIPTPTPTSTPTVTPYIPENDFIYNIIPNGDFIYTLIPNNDLTYILIPNNDLNYSLLQPTPTPTPTPTSTPTSTPTPTETPTSSFGSSGFQWMTINSVTETTASGIGQNDITLSVTQSGGGMGATEGVFNPTVFPEQYGVPFTGSQIQNVNSGTFTATFSQPVTDALVAFSSIGNSGLFVPIIVSTPFTPIFGTDVTYQNPVNATQYTQLTGNEGYAIIRIDGTVTGVTFNYTVAENYCNICFGFVNQNNLPTPTPTNTPTPTSTPTSTPTETSTPTLYLNCYTVRQHLYGYDGSAGNSSLYVLESDYPNVSTIPVGAIATINGTPVTVTSVFQYNSAYFQGGIGYIVGFEPDLGIINSGTYFEFCWYSVNPPTPTPTPTLTSTPTPTPTAT